MVSLLAGSIHSVTRMNLDVRRTRSVFYDNVVTIAYCLPASVSVCPRGLGVLSQVDDPGIGHACPSGLEPRRMQATDQLDGAAVRVIAARPTS